jgi:hypothetical protein
MSLSAVTSLVGRPDALLLSLLSVALAVVLIGALLLTGSKANN